MAELLSGKDLILFFRRRSDHATSDGEKLRFQTEHTLSLEKESESTITKDGVVNSISDGENSIDITSLAYREDTDTIEIWKNLRQYFKDNALVEVWQVDISEESDDDEYEADYFQGYFTSFEMSAPADGNVELSTTFAVNGNGATGTDVLTEAQLASIRALQYEYETIQATGDVEA